MEKIPQTTLLPGFLRYQDEYEEAALNTLRSGHYILGLQLKQFEIDFADYLNSRGEVIGVASGLDALVLAFRALDISDGDEVIVPANTYIASVMGITINGATPVFIEPNEYYNIDPREIEAAITDKTKAVLAVHLYGQACEMDKIVAISKKHGLKLIEDCAQSHGAKYNGQMTGTFGDASCFSFYPTKNLGAFGDGGAIWCRMSKVAEEIRVLRNYGSEKRYYNRVIGYNSRLDEIQAALLTIKLKHLDELNTERQEIAQKYNKLIKNPIISKPKITSGADHVYHQYVIEMPNQGIRDNIKKYLDDNGVSTIIHYPIPPHLAECYEYLGYKTGDFPVAEGFSGSILSIPIYNGLPDHQINRVAELLNAYR